MKHLTFTLLLTLFASPAALADTGAAKPAAAPVPAASAAAGTMAPHAAPAAAPGIPPKATIDWKGMSAKQRKSYMKKTVQPTMQKIFAEFDAKRYKKINCMTCHGEGANKDFKMPNAALPKLPSDMAGFKALSEKKPEATKFMATRVKPAMANLLGMEEFHPEHAAAGGFGCINCHTTEAAAGAPAAAPAAPKPGSPAAPAK